MVLASAESQFPSSPTLFIQSSHPPFPGVETHDSNSSPATRSAAAARHRAPTGAEGGSGISFLSPNAPDSCETATIFFLSSETLLCLHSLRGSLPLSIRQSTSVLIGNHYSASLLLNVCPSLHQLPGHFSCCSLLSIPPCPKPLTPTICSLFPSTKAVSNPRRSHFGFILLLCVT